MSDFVCAGCGNDITHDQGVIEFRNGFYSDTRMEIPWDEATAKSFLHAGNGEDADQPDCLSLVDLRKFITAGGITIGGFNAR